MLPDCLEGKTKTCTTFIISHHITFGVNQNTRRKILVIAHFSRLDEARRNPQFSSTPSSSAPKAGSDGPAASIGFGPPPPWMGALQALSSPSSRPQALVPRDSRPPTRLELATHCAVCAVESGPEPEPSSISSLLPFGSFEAMASSAWQRFAFYHHTTYDEECTTRGVQFS